MRRGGTLKGHVGKLTCVMSDNHNDAVEEAKTPSRWEQVTRGENRTLAEKLTSGVFFMNARDMEMYQTYNVATWEDGKEKYNRLTNGENFPGVNE